MTDDESLQAAIHEAVKLSAYDPSWPEKFEAERRRLQTGLPGAFLAVEHVGSTAVPGMSAKPIIDLLAGVESMTHARSLTERIVSMGYTTSNAFNEALVDRRWFMRWADGHRTHHLHVVAQGGDIWRAYLAFRDALRADPLLRARYALLKSDLAATHATDREAYTDAKTEFIRSALVQPQA